ncbi:MAG: PilZ domain-containing protein [Terriglobales bacterium]|jgi:PilZ domain-containing protein
MTRGKPEQRSRPRMPVQVQVSIRSGQSEVSTGFTRDLSRNGVFFYTDSQIHEGSDLEMVLMLPPGLTQGEKQWVCCQASVVRVEAAPGTGQIGVAANIRNIAALPEIPQ